MDGFYVGSFFVAEFPTPVQQDWLLPDDLEHSRETSNIEELNINPEDLELFPLEIQAGSCSYTQITFSIVDEFYQRIAPTLDDFYVQRVFDNEGFYLILVVN